MWIQPDTAKPSELSMCLRVNDVFMILVLPGHLAWRAKADNALTPAKPVLKQEEDQLSFGMATPSRAQLTGPSYQDCRVKMIS